MRHRGRYRWSSAGEVKFGIASAIAAACLLTGCSGGSETAQPTGADPSTSSSSPTTPSTTTVASPTATTPTTSARPTSVSAVTLVCGNVDKDVEYEDHTVALAADGTPDYGDLWKQRLDCDAALGDLDPASQTVPVITPLQRAVVAAAKKIGYGESGDETDTDEAVLYSVYQYCGSNRSTDPYATMKEFSDSQVDELRLWMVLCPKHPQAKTWRAGIATSAKARQAEKNGTRIYDGTYNVPSAIKRGRFVVEDVENCYWETRDKAGRILANNFVLAAPRVEAVIGPSAVVFTAEGCGQWNRQ